MSTKFKQLKFYNFFIQIFSKFINLTFPPKCLSCQEYTLTSNALCSKCWQKIEHIGNNVCVICSDFIDHLTWDEERLCKRCNKNRPYYNQVIALFFYSDQVKKLVLNYKYKDHTYLSQYFSSLLLSRLKQLNINNIDVITFIPLHIRRLLTRKFNQSGLIAQYLGNKLQLPCKSLLVRKKHTKPQNQLSFLDREKNIYDCFKINTKYQNLIKNKHILLVDDVITTGSTVSEAAKILKNHGAQTVTIVCIARTNKLSKTNLTQEFT
ncbi:ComF family protein [Rickettsiales endosymbiont of Stachyamoeba lipophora]|uniref:ComF family protein n=1 Tax=Rickettsiales endosymbiont of Stachyamoeba lipophora TaxID=2486578 RepID=UPI000F64DBDE|nr:ComF family protein [Rickettsiales endosymbiont of Stachyamoeba lipophora]AZL16223.1 ComF family protein [Rickettsiales endosymbiont of Stachyamoeba lipophora]